MYLFLILMLWAITIIVGMMDISLARHLFNQWRANAFQSTVGQITRSEIARDAQGRDRFHLIIQTRYEVDGAVYVGDRWAYSLVALTEKSASELAASYPVGATIDIYYDSANPSDSVVSRGFTGSELLALMAIMPFNLIVLIGWFAWLAKKQWQLWLSASREITPSPQSIYLRYRWAQGLYEALGILVFVPIVLFLGIGLITKFEVSMNTAALAWLFLICCAAGVFVWRWFGFNSAGRFLHPH